MHFFDETLPRYALYMVRMRMVYSNDLDLFLYPTTFPITKIERRFHFGFLKKKDGMCALRRDYEKKKNMRVHRKP